MAYLQPNSDDGRKMLISPFIAIFKAYRLPSGLSIFNENTRKFNVGIISPFAT